MDTILLATDGSPSAQSATAEAIELAKATGWTLHVLTLWRTPTLTSSGYAPVMYLPEVEAEAEHAAETARRAVALAREAGLDATSEVREGVAAAEVCAVAAERGVRLIVMGAHGWGTFKRLVFGSVSTTVMHGAPCPVLIVRMTESEIDLTPAETAVTADS